ncbi:hypothetical protein [Clostridium sp. CTA-1]
MDERGLIYNLGWYEDLAKYIIIDDIKKIARLDNRQIMIREQKNINENGVEKLVMEIEKIKNRDE